MEKMSDKNVGSTLLSHFVSFIHLEKNNVRNKIILADIKNRNTMLENGLIA